MMNNKEAKRFLNLVRENAPLFSKSAIAHKLNIPLQTFNNRLLEALTLLHETPPDFFRGRLRKTTEENVDTIRATGQGGHAKRIIVPQHVFKRLKWDVDDKIKFRIHGKKLIIEKL